MQHFYQNIPGWFTFSDFYKEIVNAAMDGNHFIEVGAFRGRSAAYMAVEIINSGKNIKFDVVDVWDTADNSLKIFKNNLSSVLLNVNPIQMDSIEASKMYKDNSIDFIYIDSGHIAEYTYNEILSWYPKVKNGGILSGHDYKNDSWPGVTMAVDKFFGKKNVRIHPKDSYTWIMYKKIKC